MPTVCHLQARCCKDESSLQSVHAALHHSYTFAAPLLLYLWTPGLGGGGGW